MSSDAYESLPTRRVGIIMLAGSVAGVFEHCVMFPVDSVKTRMQSLVPPPNASYRSLQEGLWKMVTHEGALRPLRGMSAVIFGAGPAHALYFAAYEFIKEFRTNNGFFNTCIDVVKQRIQMYNSHYKSCLDCVRNLYATEGLRPFYRSYSTQLVMNLPFHAVYIVSYEKLMELFNQNKEYNPKAYMAAGGLAGAVAAAFTTPLDVCKTLLNTQEETTLAQLRRKRVIGIWQAVKSIYALQGVPGFFRGMQARVIYQIPSAAISWTVYELFKFHLSKNNRIIDNSGSSVEKFFEDKLTRDKISAHSDKFNVSKSKTVECFPNISVSRTLTASCSPTQEKLLRK